MPASPETESHRIAPPGPRRFDRIDGVRSSPCGQLHPEQHERQLERVGQMAGWLACVTGNGHRGGVPGSTDSATIGAAGVVTVNTAQSIGAVTNAGSLIVDAARCGPPAASRAAAPSPSRAAAFGHCDDQLRL